MARVRKYIDTNVYEESKNRINHIFDIFDSVVVMFSGGKDSLVLLNLVREVTRERGVDKVDVVFLDEELVHSSVVEFIDRYKKLEWVNLYYYAVPLRSTKFILGETTNYIQWDKNRPHVRRPPPYAITLPEGDNRVFSQNTIQELISGDFKGKTAFLIGIRADEGLMRYRSSVNKLNENYINNPSRDEYRKIKKPVPKNFMICKPIFDWTENDIFKYLYDNEIEYCKIYDNQLWAKRELRVATPLISESSKHFSLLKLIDPILYEQVLNIFPEMRLQERYFKEVDFDGVRKKYSESIEMVEKWIDENITTEKENDLAKFRLERMKRYQKNKPELYNNREILNYFMSGAYKRPILLRKRERKTK